MNEYEGCVYMCKVYMERSAGLYFTCQQPCALHNFTKFAKQTIFGFLVLLLRLQGRVFLKYADCRVFLKCVDCSVFLKCVDCSVPEMCRLQSVPEMCRLQSVPEMCRLQSVPEMCRLQCS